MKCMREGIEKHKQELDDQLEKTKKKIREMEVINTEIEIKKKDLVKMIRKGKRKKEEMKGEIELAKQEMEVKQKTEGQRSEQALEVNTEGRFDEQEIRLKQVDRTREIMQHTSVSV